MTRRSPGLDVRVKAQVRAQAARARGCCAGQMRGADAEMIHVLLEPATCGQQPQPVEEQEQCGALKRLFQNVAPLARVVHAQRNQPGRDEAVLSGLAQLVVDEKAI